MSSQGQVNPETDQAPNTEAGNLQPTTSDRSTHGPTSPLNTPSISSRCHAIPAIRTDNTCAPPGEDCPGTLVPARWHPQAPDRVAFVLPRDIMGYYGKYSGDHLVRREPFFDTLNRGAMAVNPPRSWMAPPTTRLRMCTPVRWWGEGYDTREQPGSWRTPPFLTEAEQGPDPITGPTYQDARHLDPNWYHPNNDDYTNVAFRAYAAHIHRTAAMYIPALGDYQVVPHPESRPPQIFNIPRLHPGHRIEIMFAVHLPTRMVHLAVAGSARRLSIYEEYEGYCRERLGNIVITGFCGPYQGFFLFRMRTRNQAGLPFRLEYPRYVLIPREYVVEAQLWPLTASEREVLTRDWRIVRRGGKAERLLDQDLSSGKGTSYSGQFEKLGVEKSREYHNAVERDEEGRGGEKSTA